LKPLEVLKIGSVISKTGQLCNFTERDLRQMAAIYDQKLYRAPLVIGHPTEDAPAYGFVKSLSYENGVLLAEPAQVDPVFAELVNSGKYLSLSCAFYLTNSLNNPKNGKGYYLRHLGFLGATPPAVKGLAAPSFADSDNGIDGYIIDFAVQPKINLWDVCRYV